MNKITRIFNDISSKATTALIKEVHLTPKPGLVDMNNTGSHQDMDVDLFLRSADAFTPYFYEYCMAGFTNVSTPEKILPSIRQIGMRAEHNMFVVTDNINTHKGANFSFGVILSSIGYYYGLNGLDTDSLSWQDITAILELVKVICHKLVERDFAHLNQKEHLSYGERLYLEYGFAGIRLEVENGFPTLSQFALPLLQENQDMSEDDKYLLLLLTFMAHVDDSNIIHRGGFESLALVKDLSKSALLSYKQGNVTITELLLALDQELISRNLSSGGCADLLALSIFFDSIVTTTD